MKEPINKDVQPTDPNTAPPVPAAEAGTFPSYEELQQQVAVLSEKVTALEDHISISDAENERLLAKLKAFESNGGSLENVDKRGAELPAFTHANKQYRFTKAQFKLDGKLCTAAEAVTDAALLKRLIEMRVGFIQEII
jgi:phage I-like protein